jgi:hypothetical protein
MFHPVVFCVSSLNLAILNCDRMVDEQKVSGSDVCVFEMTERVGGRLMSLRGLGPESDLAVDAGGYRTVRISRERIMGVSPLDHATISSPCVRGSLAAT